MARNAGRARKAGKARKARKEVRRDERDSERKMKNFEELDIWRQGCQLAVDIYQVTEEGPFSKDFGLRDQIRRSAVSIPSNILGG